MRVRVLEGVLRDADDEARDAKETETRLCNFLIGIYLRFLFFAPTLRHNREGRDGQVW